MAAFAIFKDVYDIDFDPNSSKIVLTLDVIVFNTTSESRSPMQLTVTGAFESSDWRIKIKDAIQTKALSELGEDVQWVMLGDFNKT
jgi:hypothetical protein